MGLTAALLVILPKLSQTKEVTIPNVIDMTELKAAETLEALGLTVITDENGEASETIEAGRVAKTSPSSGRKAKVGSEVTLYLSTGSEFIELENYVGKSYLDIQTDLENKYNLKVTIENTPVEKSKYKKNIILEQSPEAGEKVKYGGSIVFYVGVLEVTYPDFTNGYSIEEVKEFCDNNGVTLNISYTESELVSEGTIIKQSRPEGYTVTSGTTLTITVTKVPQVEDETPDTPIDEETDNDSEVTE